MAKTAPNCGATWIHLAHLVPIPAQFGSYSRSISCQQGGRCCPNTKLKKNEFSLVCFTFSTILFAIDDASFPMLCFHWAQIGTGAKLSPKAPKLRRFGRDLGFHSSDPFGSSFGVRFGHEIAQQLSTSWAYLGFYLGFYLRPNFGARCPHTGPSWVCWVQLARVGHKLSPSWAQVGSCSAQLHAKDCQF